MNKILYATDFSENAKKAFGYVSKLAQYHNADLIMLHVFDIPTSFDFPYIDDAREMEQQTLRESKGKLKELFNQYSLDVDVDFMAIENTSVAKGIISVANENNPDLIVVGTKGGSKIREILVGSTTKDLVRHAPYPVLAVPESAGDGDFSRVVYATDFREEDLEAIVQLIELIKPFDSEIIVAHVSTPDEYDGDEKFNWFKKQVRERVSYHKLKFQPLLWNNGYERLNSYLKQYKIDLFVMLEKEHHGIAERLFHGDTVEKMEFHVTMPLLSFSEHFLHEKV